MENIFFEAKSVGGQYAYVAYKWDKENGIPSEEIILEKIAEMEECSCFQHEDWTASDCSCGEHWFEGSVRELNFVQYLFLSLIRDAK